MEVQPLISPIQQPPLRYLVFSASLRTDSLNTRLIKSAIKVIEKNGGVVDYATMTDFDSPSFNQDLEVKGIFPKEAGEFNKRINSCDAFIISSPEYNGSLPGVLKNAIDWVSRLRPQPFNEKNALLMSASPSMIGGNRALWSLRIPLEHLGTRVYPNMFSLAMAHKAFTPDGDIADDILAKRFEETIIAFMSLSESSKHYPCIKKAWVEFLGERADLLLERIE